jgi:putative phosphonate metabolism protein
VVDRDCDVRHNRISISAPMTQTYPRFAIYYAPEPTELLATRARIWLGYDAETGNSIQQPVVAGFSTERLRHLTTEPRRYGFHGTLKPPFALTAGTTETMLIEAVGTFCATQSTVRVGPMKVAAISDFIALVPASDGADVAVLAAACVRRFDAFRAVSGTDEIARRRAAGLSPRQEELLRRWGYPYVMEEFRFHLTLTGKVTDQDSDVLLPALGEMFASEKVGSVTVKGLAVFKQPAADEPFRVLARVPFAGQAG